MSWVKNLWKTISALKFAWKVLLFFLATAVVGTVAVATVRAGQTFLQNIPLVGGLFGPGVNIDSILAVHETIKQENQRLADSSAVKTAIIDSIEAKVDTLRLPSRIIRTPPETLFVARADGAGIDTLRNVVIVDSAAGETRTFPVPLLIAETLDQCQHLAEDFPVFAQACRERHVADSLRIRNLDSMNSDLEELVQKCSDNVPLLGCVGTELVVAGVFVGGILTGKWAFGGGSDKTITVELPGVTDTVTVCRADNHPEAPFIPCSFNRLIPR